MTTSVADLLFLLAVNPTSYAAGSTSEAGGSGIESAAVAAAALNAVLKAGVTMAAVQF